jgi:mRNA-degrading endonuclease RelE of RelBE toxin-antitoxin system
MPYAIEFHPKAMAEYIEAYKWYENKRAGLGERFTMEVNTRIQTVKSNPLLFPIRKGNFREARVSIFPYTVVYQVDKKEQVIIIVAVYHSKRKATEKYRKKKNK